MAKLLFGGILATVLLGFYIWSLAEAVGAAHCGGGDCRGFSTNMSFLLNSIGGLISATVVGVLGATQAGEFPSLTLYGRNISGIVRGLAAYMPSIYILVWIVCGVVTVIYGFILYPESDPVPPLFAQAKVWLGTAIASVYAYFGISPDTRTGGR